MVTDGDDKIGVLDVEQQLPHNQGEGNDMVEGESGQEHSATDPPPTANPWLTWMTAHTVFIVLLPLLAFYVLVSLCLTGSDDGIGECRRRILGRRNTQSPSPSAALLKNTKVGLIFQRSLQVWVTRVGMTALICLTVNLCVPRFQHVNLIRGWVLWKLFLLVVTLTLGYPIACLVSAAFIGIVTFGGYLIRRTNAEYFITKLEKSIATCFYLGFILAIWLLYFRTDHGLDRSRYFNIINDLGTWTLVSLLVGSVLWLAKDLMLLKWRANVVYMRFKLRILRAGLQLYLLTLIVNGVKARFLVPWRQQAFINMNDTTTTTMSPSSWGKKSVDDDEDILVQEGFFTENINLNGVGGDKKRELSSNHAYLLSMQVSMLEMYKVSKFVMYIAHAALRENDGNPEIVRQYQEKVSTTDSSRNMDVTKENLIVHFNLNEEDVALLFTELENGHSSEDITYEAFLKWMVSAHTNCLLLGYTLIDAMDVIQSLNKVVTLFIVGAVILFWLMITGVATSKVLVLVASPILALTFVFGETCRTFFQGVMFSFVTHPLEIGDRCIVDGIELEVKHISIMMTTFLKIGTKEKVVYPNSELACKPITNHEAEPNPNDVIQLVLDTSTTKSQLLDLEKKLKFFLENEKGVYQKNYKMMVKEMGNTIKVSVHFTHVMSIEDVSHSQCFQKKNEQRSAFFIEIKQFLDDLKIMPATST